MKFSHIRNLTIYTLILLAFSCSNDNEEELFGSLNFTCDQTVTYSDLIKPIMDTNCTVAGCHVPGTGLPDFTRFSIIEIEASEIRKRTQSREMPQGGRVLTKLQIAEIACWIDNGALNN